MIKNRAVTGFPFLLINKTTGAAVTTGIPSGYVTIDGGAQTPLSGSCAHEGNGQWTIDITASEMNGDLIGLLFTHVDAIPVSFTIATTGVLPSLGPGAIAWTYILVTSLGAPIADADIWVTTDSAGSNIIASGRTDQNGQVTFYLDAGTIYVWAQKTGMNFTNPDAEVVS
jgi:hypothetical protein